MGRFGHEGLGSRVHLFSGLQLTIGLVVLANVNQEGFVVGRSVDASLVAKLSGKEGLADEEGKGRKRGGEP